MLDLLKGTRVVSFNHFLLGPMSGASAADIGRLHLDPSAWRAAAHVGASILKASLTNQTIYPQAFFPFEGKTELVAAGKWLSFADQPKATLLVYNLRSCSHPALGSPTVVRTTLPRRTPRRPMWRMSRSTVQRATVQIDWNVRSA